MNLVKSSKDLQRSEGEVTTSTIVRDLSEPEAAETLAWDVRNLEIHNHAAGEQVDAVSTINLRPTTSGLVV